MEESGTRMVVISVVTSTYQERKSEKGKMGQVLIKLLKLKGKELGLPTAKFTLPEIEDRHRFDLQAQFLNALFTSTC